MQNVTIPIGTSGPSDNLDLSQGLPLVPKVGGFRAGISTDGSSDDFFNSGITILFSRVKASAYYNFVMGMLGPAVAFTFQGAGVSLDNVTNNNGAVVGQVKVSLPNQEMKTGMYVGMVFGGGVWIVEQLYLPSSWTSPWKFTWQTVFQGSIGFEIDFLALFLELISYLLDQGTEDGIFAKDTANTLNKFVKGRETFQFYGLSENSLGQNTPLHAVARYSFPINLVDYIAPLAGFVKVLEKVCGDLAFGPSFDVLMPTDLSIKKFQVTGGQGGTSVAEYAPISYDNDGVITATGGPSFTAQATKFTTEVEYSAGFSVGISCYFSLSACKIFSVSFYTATLDLLTLLNIPTIPLGTSTGSVSTSLSSGCVLIPDLTLVFTSSQPDPTDNSIMIAGQPFLAEALLAEPWNGADTSVQIRIDPPYDGFPSSLPLTHGTNSVEFLFTFPNQCVYSGDTTNTGAKVSPSYNSPYQSYSITAFINSSDPNAPCLDLETTTSIKLKNSVIFATRLTGTPGDAPVWNPEGGAQVNADSTQEPLNVLNYTDVKWFFQYPQGASVASNVPVKITLYDEDRNVHIGSDVRISFQSGQSATLVTGSAQLTTTIPASSSTQTFRVQWLSSGPHINFSNRFILVVDAGCGYGQLEFWLSVWNWS